jgi:nucleotide-binding universal stress UspA family protein
MYDRVIVPLDGSPMAERALAPAVEVAQRAGAELVATMVVDDDVTEDHRAYVKHLLSPFDVVSPPPYIIEADDAAECIANAGEAERSLVVMTSHGSSGLRRAVLRAIQKPVLLIGPQCEVGRAIAGGRVLVPLDGSRRAEAILEPVAAWCDLMALQTWTVTAVDPGPAASEVPDDAYLRRVTRQLSDLGISSSWDVLHQHDAANALVTFALGLPASLVAMTTHGRTGLARVTLGSVATRVVHEVTSPVLLLRPELEEATVD